MNSKDFLKEGFVEDATDVHMDHEVQMAREECYHAAEHALAIHKLLRNISEQQGLEGWVSSKITLANDYLNTVREHLEYELLQPQIDDVAIGMPIAENEQQGVAEGMEGQVVFSGSGADGGKYEIIQTGPTDFMIHANGKHIDTYSSLQRAMSVLKNEVPGLNKGVAEGSINEGQYEMMMRNGRVKKFVAKDDADAKRIAAGHGAKSVIRLKGGVPAGKVAEQGVVEGLTKQARARKEAESVKAAIERLEQQLKDPNPHIDKDDIRRRLETEKRRLELYRDVLDEQGMAEGLPGSLSKSDYTSGKTVKHTSSNCTACHGRKTMYKLDGKLYADNKAGATKVKCPTCKGTGDKQGVAEGSAPGQAAWKKEMIEKGAVSFKRDQHGGGTVDRIVAYDKDGKVVGGFNRKGVAEGAKCNHTMEGKSCPVHDLNECPGMKARALAEWRKQQRALKHNQSVMEFAPLGAALAAGAGLATGAGLSLLKKQDPKEPSMQQRIKDKKRQEAEQRFREKMDREQNKVSSSDSKTFTQDLDLINVPESKSKLKSRKIREQGITDQEIRQRIQPTFQATDAQINDPEWMRSRGLIPMQDIEAGIKTADEQGQALNQAQQAGFPTYQHQGQTYGVMNPKYGKGGSTGQPKPLTPQQIQQTAGTNIVSGSGAPVTAGSKMLTPNQRMGGVNETTAGSVAGVVNPKSSKPKNQVGSLFGGTYTQKRKGK